MPNTPMQSADDSSRMDAYNVHPIEQDALLAALDNTTIHYYRFFPKERLLVLPEATAREWQCEMIYTGVPENEAFFAYLADEYKAGFVEMFTKILDGTPTATTSFQLDEFDRWCRVTMTTVRWDDDGSPLETIAIIEDRSEDMAREALNVARNETLAFLNQVFEIAADATDSTVVIYDYDTNTTTAPRSTADEWGVPAEHHNGPLEIADSDIIMPESKDDYIAVHKMMLDGASEARTKIRLRDPNGDVSTHELIFQALKDPEGKPLRKAVGVYNKISDFEEKRQHQEAMSRALAQGINAAFFVDLDNNTFTPEEVISEDMSEAARNFIMDNTGRSTFDETARKYCEELVREEDRERIMNELSSETIIRKLKEHPSYFIQYRMVDNPERQEYFETHIAAADHAPGNKAFISFRCIDAQKSRELQQQQAMKDAFTAAQQASKTKSEFFSRMSHDIRTPMNAIVGMTALASTHIDDKNRVLDCLSKINVSSQHLLGLINDVLDMSKIESGMIDLNVEDFDLSKLVENLITMSRHIINVHKHELVVNVHDIEHEKVVGDPQRIQQAFMNLMSNAIKYTPSGGTIRVSITEKHVKKDRTGCYEFVFEDNGIGMTPEFIEHIFEPFTRAKDNRVNEQQGTGLGMSITNNIVQMMNGSITVESELGKGSKFTVTIFLELQDDEIDTSLEQLEGLPVLVVDDDQATCESACSVLNDLGMRCDWVTSGQEAVKLVEKNRADGKHYFALIIDWKMPDMDGLATTRAIHETAHDNTPIIIASAYDWSDIEAPAHGAGVSGFISKPLFRSRLLHQFKMLLNGGMDDATAPTSAVDSIRNKDLTGMRVLLVEDNQLNKEIATEFLEMAGLEVHTAENGREAVDAMEASEDNYYDIVFMDIQMPLMNGYDAARAIRSSQRKYLKSVPIIAMTADAFAEDVHESQLAGMNEHLAKPIDIDKLSGVLERWLGSQPRTASN